MYFATMPHNIF